MLVIQMFFENPDLISTGLIYDDIRFEILKEDVFVSEQGLILNKNLLIAKICKQIRPSPEAMSVLNSAKGSVTVVQSFTAIDSIVSFSI